MTEKPESVTKAIIFRMFYLDILTALERDLDQRSNQMPIYTYKQRENL